MLTFLSQQAAARFDMKFFLKNKLTLLLISIIFFVQAPYVFAEDQLKIIERDNFHPIFVMQKKSSILLQKLQNVAKSQNTFTH